MAWTVLNTMSLQLFWSLPLCHPEGNLDKPGLLQGPFMGQTFLHLTTTTGLSVQELLRLLPQEYLPLWGKNKTEAHKHSNLSRAQRMS